MNRLWFITAIAGVTLFASARRVRARSSTDRSRYGKPWFAPVCDLSCRREIVA